MSEKKPTPLLCPTKGKTCPVCGNRTYSLGGIHPQCAVTQADAPRAKKLLAERKREVAKAKPSKWRNKKCSKCRAECHVRRRVCDCGHAFF
jgi:hypothetical protein